MFHLWALPDTTVPRRNQADATARAFGEAVDRVRRQRGETLEQVASRIDRMDSKYLGSIIGGWHSPTVSTAKRIADALETSLAELVKEI